MPLDHIADAIGFAADVVDVADTAETVHRKWGCGGCLIAIPALGLPILLLLWALGAFLGA